MGILFAFGSLAFTAFNDLWFKAYRRKSNAQGMFVALVGIVWMILALLLWQIGAVPVALGHWQATLIWGVISGIFSVAANLLLLEAMARQNVGICSTIYRLNLLFVVLGAALLLHESLNLQQWGGILLEVITVLLFLPPRDQTADAAGIHARKNALLGILLAVIAAALRAALGLAGKCGIAWYEADSNGISLVAGAMWLIGGVIYALLRERDALIPDRRTIGFSLLSGVLVCGIVITMMAALKYGDASIVIPLSQMSFLPTFALGVWLFKEKMTSRSVLALLAGIAAVLLLSL